MQIRILGSAIAVVLAGCGTPPVLAGDLEEAGHQTRPAEPAPSELAMHLNDRVLIPDATGEKVDVEPGTNGIEIVNLDLGTPAIVRPGGTMRVSIPFRSEAPIEAAGIRFGGSGPITKVAIETGGIQAGTAQFDVTIPLDICDDLESSCHWIACNEFLFDEDGQPSFAAVTNLVLTCNDCRNDQCARVLPECAPPFEPDPTEPLCDSFAPGPELVAIGAGLVQSVAVDETHVYWSAADPFDPHGIYRTPKRGGSSPEKIVDGGTENLLFFDGKLFYTTNRGWDDGIWMFDPITGEEALVGDPGRIDSFAFDGHEFFTAPAWVCIDDDVANREIYAVRPDGASRIVIEAPGCVSEVAVDDVHVYFTVDDGSDQEQVLRVRKDGSNIERLASGLTVAGGLVVSDGGLYFINAPNHEPDTPTSRVSDQELVRIDTVTGRHETVYQGLDYAGVHGADGRLYLEASGRTWCVAEYVHGQGFGPRYSVKRVGLFTNVAVDDSHLYLGVNAPGVVVRTDITGH